MIRTLNMALHITPASNLSSIAANGLIPAIGPLSKLAGETVPRVYLFPSPSEAMTALDNWLGELFEDASRQIALLLVDVTGLTLDEGVSYEIACQFTIPPSRLEVITCDLDSLVDLDRGIEKALESISTTMQYHCLSLDEWRALGLMDREKMKSEVEAIAATYLGGGRRDLALGRSLFG